MDIDINTDIINKIVESKYHGFKLLELKLPVLKPGILSNKIDYIPVIEEELDFRVWITNTNKVEEIKISLKEYYTWKNKNKQ